MLEWSARRMERRMSLDRRAFLGFAAASPAAALGARARDVLDRRLKDVGVIS